MSAQAALSLNMLKAYDLEPFCFWFSKYKSSNQTLFPSSNDLKDVTSLSILPEK